MRLGMGAGYEKIPILKRCGYDYFEYNLVGLYGLDHAEFMEAERLVNRMDFYSESMNIMLPPHITIVGKNVDYRFAQDYLKIALDRAKLLGCKKVSFGSSHSRNMPRGFSDRKLAYSQIVTFLKMVSEMLEKREMSLVIEPCPIHENNIITFIAEAYYVMRKVNKPNVHIMADTYSMQFGYEKLETIAIYGQDIKHLHFSAPDREFPLPGDGHDYSEFFNLITDMGYDGTLTIEAFHPDDFETGAQQAYRLMRDLLTAAQNRRR